MKIEWRLFFAVFAAVVVAGLSWNLWPESPPDWSGDEVEALSSLSLQSLPELPADPSNHVADNRDAAEFGEKLFMDARLSANGGISCSTCHQPIRRFTDGLPKGQAIGMSKRNTPSIVGTAYSPWQYWDGRRDSQWSQALSPLEDTNEHGSNRESVARLIAADHNYRKTYETLFGPIESDPTAVFVNIGKSIAAFERTLMPTSSRFDDYVAAVVAGDEALQRSLFSNDEAQGLKLFVGDANCTQCHNGPLLTNNEFHNTGVISFPGDVPDKGRIDGVKLVADNEFNCRSKHNDDPSRLCAELEFARTGPELLGAMRTPSLRNLENTAPYMHKGQLQTLTDVIRHYDEAPMAMIGHNEAKPLDLSATERAQLEAFLLTLAAPVGGTAP